MPKDDTNLGELGELSSRQKFMIKALIDYIATTPQNINYNIVREIIKAAILDEEHPYFEYYFKKIGSEEPDKPEPDPGDTGTQVAQ